MDDAHRIRGFRGSGAAGTYTTYTCRRTIYTGVIGSARMRQ